MGLELSRLSSQIHILGTNISKGKGIKVHIKISIYFVFGFEQNIKG